MPKTEDSAAVTSAMNRLVVSASVISGLEKALPYHSSEKPCQIIACLPALKEPATISAMGA